MKEVIATYHNNYNGWSLEVDGQYCEDDDAICELVDITVDHTDEDGGYFFNYSLMEEDDKAVKETLKRHFGNDIKIIIEMDSIST